MRKSPPCEASDQCHWQSLYCTFPPKILACRCGRHALHEDCSSPSQKVDDTHRKIPSSSCSDFLRSAYYYRKLSRNDSQRCDRHGAGIFAPPFALDLCFRKWVASHQLGISLLVVYEVAVPSGTSDREAFFAWAASTPGHRFPGLL